MTNPKLSPELEDLMARIAQSNRASQQEALCKIEQLLLKVTDLEKKIDNLERILDRRRPQMQNNYNPTYAK